MRLKRCSTSLILKEMQIKTKIKCYFSSINLTKIKSWYIGKTVWEKALIYFWWELPSRNISNVHTF